MNFKIGPFIINLYLLASVALSGAGIGVAAGAGDTRALSLALALAAINLALIGREPDGS